MIIKNGIIFIWSGTNASIPSGWSRVTDMDDKYPKGTANGTDPNTTSGATTHAHAATGSHTHAIEAHTHSIDIVAGSGGGTATGSYASANSVLRTHTHADITSGAVAGATVSTETPSYAAFSNHPPYYNVIYVTPTNYATFLPVGIISLADAAAPAGFYACNGSNGTPNLVDKYLRGANAGANAGGTGGSTTNIHDLTHVHTTSHSHASATSGNANAGWADKTTSAGTIINYVHTHTCVLGATTPSTTDNVSLTTTETVEPAYTKLMAIYNSVAQRAPLNIIALWLGTLAAIPKGWILCDSSGGTIDMRDRHLKITATVGEIGNTGGSNTHSHASQTHSHAVSHSHTGTSNDHTATLLVNGTGVTAATATTVHALTGNTKDFTTTNGSSAADSQNNEPPYRTVAFIKLVSRIQDSFLLNFIH